MKVSALVIYRAVLEIDEELSDDQHLMRFISYSM
jgi:hypothetical protein